MMTSQRYFKKLKKLIDFIVFIFFILKTVFEKLLFLILFYFLKVNLYLLFLTHYGSLF